MLSTGAAARRPRCTPNSPPRMPGGRHRGRPARRSTCVTLPESTESASAWQCYARMLRSMRASVAPGTARLMAPNASLIALRNVGWCPAAGCRGRQAGAPCQAALHESPCTGSRQGRLRGYQGAGLAHLSELLCAQRLAGQAAQRGLQLRGRHKAIAVLVVHAERDCARGAPRVGAHAWISKLFPCSHFIVADGDTSFCAAALTRS